MSVGDTTGETVWLLDIVGYSVGGGTAEVFASAEKAMAKHPHVQWSDPDKDGEISELAASETTDIWVITPQVVQ